MEKTPMEKTLKQVRERGYRTGARRVTMMRNDCAAVTISVDAKGNVLDDLLRPTGRTVDELRDDGFTITG